MAFAIINGMKLTIDGSGRLVLPKKVRERYRLRAGAQLELEENAEGIVLKPAQQGPSMVRINGLWVHLGRVPEGFDWDKMIDNDREERIKDIWGQ